MVRGRKNSGNVLCARPFVLSRSRKFGNPLASAASLPQEVVRSRRRIVTTRIYEGGVLSSSNGNVRGKRERRVRVCGRGYETRGMEKERGGTEKLKHQEENIRDSRGTA